MELNDTLELIKNEVERFKSKEYIKINQGKRYYNHQNDIVERSKKIYMKGRGLIEDPYSANHRLPSDFTKLLVKQKVNYSVNENIMLETDSLDVIEENFPKWRKNIKRSATHASYKIREFWLFYVDKNTGKLKYKVIPAEQGIPIYNDYDRDKIEKFIRYYKSGDEKRAELYDSQMVTYYKMDGGKWRLDRSKPPHAHMVMQDIVNGNVVGETGTSWGRPPVAILNNNDELKTDLDPIKAFIDIYDITNSDFANNIDDFQDVFWILKNYQGQDMEEFLYDLKQTKGIPVGENGDASAETIDIPVEARKEFLGQTKENIYRFGQGVDMDAIKGGNVTNVMIQAMFSNLDLKANDFEQEIQDFWEQVMWFLNKYLEISNKGVQVESKLNFDRSMMMNLKELMETNSMASGIVSNETQLENNPYVQDIEEEKKRLENEKQSITLDE